MQKFGFISGIKAIFASEKFRMWVKKNHPTDYKWFLYRADDFWDIYAEFLTELEKLQPVCDEKEACGRFTNQRLMKVLYYFMRENYDEPDVEELMARGLYALNRS